MYTAATRGPALNYAAWRALLAVLATCPELPLTQFELSNTLMTRDKGSMRTTVENRP